MPDIVKRQTIENMYEKKVWMLNQIGKMKQLDTELERCFEDVNGYSPARIDWKFDNFEKDREEKYIDRTMWFYLVNLFSLEKYMLCTDYDKMKNDVWEFRTPQFSVENANGWLEGLKDLIFENVKTMVKDVYKRITGDVYFTGSGYANKKRKKRNNAGIDTNFIITTYDYSRVFSYWQNSPTITDDLEKVCYILDGKTLPDTTIIQEMKKGNLTKHGNDYFEIKLCQNGNTHYKLTDETRDRLNLCGPAEAVIGENIRIKVFNNLH
jgi:hypothetical protein